MGYKPIESQIMIQDLVVMYDLYGKVHEVHAGKLDAEYQEREKPLAATRGFNKSV